jgi:selenide,water dikinase
MMEASGTTAQFWVESIPLLSEARRFAARGIAPDGSRVNVRNLRPRSEVGSAVTDDDFLLLCDAQTSGGLLVALPAEQAEAYAVRCRERGAESASVVGRVEPRGAFLLDVQKQKQKKSGRTS